MTVRTVTRAELRIPSTFKHEPIFYHIIKKFKVVPNIIEASFSTEMGWAVVGFEGDDKELEKMFEFLKKQGVQISFH